MENTTVTISTERFTALICAEMQLKQIDLMRGRLASYEHKDALTIILGPGENKEASDDA